RMVGRPVLLRVEKGPPHPGPPGLEVGDLVVNNDRGTPAVNGLELVVRSGEVFGIAGVEGNGQTELVEAITGLRPVREGRILLAGRDLTAAGPRTVIHAGVSHIPEDRHKYGL